MKNLLIFLLLFLNTFSYSQIFYTESEIEVWKNKITNQDEGWNRIQAVVNNFITNPTADRWSGYWTGNSPIPQGDQYAPEKEINGLFTTAFASVITGEYRDICLQELEWYVNNEYLDASNQTRFSRTNIFPSSNINDGSPGFDMAAGYLKLFLTYYYLKDEITDHIKYEKFFVSAADYFNALNNYGFAGIFNSQGEVINKEYYAQEGATTFDNGYATEKLGRYYNNRRGDYIRYVAYIGVYYNIEEYKEAAKTFFKNYIKYAIYPDGTAIEMYRGGGGQDEKGWQYSAITANEMLEVADIFWRSGDNSLYEYTTSEGIGKTVGGNKNLELVLNAFLNYVDGTWNRTEEGKRIDSYSEYHNAYYVCQTWFAQANLYYKNDRIKAGYIDAPVAPIIGVGGEKPYVGNSNTCPDKLFVYANMEGVRDSIIIIPPEEEPETPGDTTIIISLHNELHKALESALGVQITRKGSYKVELSLPDSIITIKQPDLEIRK